MDGLIARGAISSVLAQARASLKHPSRPFTPKTGTRPLFYGDDYRPSSRPSSTFSTDASEFEKPKKKRPSRRRDNQEVEVVTTPISTARDNDRPQSSMSEYEPRCGEKASPSSRGLDAKATSDDMNDENELAPVSTIEALADRLEELQQHLDSFRAHADQDEEAFATVQAICKATSQVYHDTHLLRDESALGALAAANAACLSQLFECIDVAAGRSVIELTRASITLYVCRLGPLDAFEDAVVHAAKLLFLQSKDPTNDDHFCHVAVVETLVGVLSDASSSKKGPLPMQLLIYVAGTLKNASSTTRMVSLLATNGAISILKAILHLHVRHDGSRGGENPVAQLLVQVTAILRNLAVHKSCHKQFWHWHVTEALCALLPLYPSHLELMLNISRVLSKLTLHEAGRSPINKSPDILGDLVALLDLSSSGAPHRFQAALLVRLCFVLGNLTASNEKNRKLLAVSHRAVSILVRTLQQYGRLYMQQSSSTKRAPHDTDEDDDDDEEDEDDESMDVLVKLMRLLANISINATAGAIAAASPGLDCLFELLSHATQCGHDELQLNIVSCLTNLSYYASPTESAPNVVTTHRIELATALCAGLVDPNDEMVIEAARALGNLARFPDVLAHLVQTQSFEMLLALLEHPSKLVVSSVCGILMNAALDGPSRKALLSLQARDALTTLFRSVGLTDVACSTLVCKALYNLGLQSTTKSFATHRLLLSTLEELSESTQDAEAGTPLAEFMGVARALMRSLLA
ncbi:hypothetical protein SPRG_02254 [Saprolegnia parasitica CBS 223.65]|uniref:Armadillo repeat-containing domain-containing protein n=1 Tax=Saprolegnia parasitica (strain CBS 223.65) TaxID=695850 RepID=A0A067D334_SAPPC|nr:hypothetical protein SPRG_02254 [Saprolegnia parasitica CBS 223.65]KDO33447.1 hypothetical protein SPRG_02254 [Saprolegnia parasitica CBS 223.65]|eukprot:XP_012196193.1 hypothetical protein SPRG_02254 [Saprolegnia parasitica CBS 223.65]